MLIPPSVGRVVLFRPRGSDPESQPLAAMIARVNDDGSINIGYLDTAGVHRNAIDVILHQDGEPRPDTAETAFCEWMPFQIGQAKQQSMVAGGSLAAASRYEVLNEFRRDEARDTIRESKIDDDAEPEEGTPLEPTEENTRPDGAQ